MTRRQSARPRASCRGLLSTACSFALAWVVWPATAGAADLPPHRRLRILVVSDEVNPHGLANHELTQPGDISFALRQPGSGLNLDPAPDGVVEIATNAIEQATALLSVPIHDPAAYDALIYFSHRIPDNGNDAQGRQDAFASAVEAFLQAGGGVISFHHGAYATAGKAGILELIGATASGPVPWNTVAGQNVINTAPGHWVTCQEVEYPGVATYADTPRGVAPGSYAAFNNTPDERYPFFDYDPSALAHVQTLFGSDYDHNGTTHLLGFVHRRPEWLGAVVGYQPGEYQPNALDDFDGNNFQILANAILFAAGTLPPDRIVLEVVRGPAADEVTLVWAACDATFAVHGSPDPAAVGSPPNELGQTTSRTWSDTPVDTLTYYLVQVP